MTRTERIVRGLFGESIASAGFRVKPLRVVDRYPEVMLRENVVRAPCYWVGRGEQDDCAADPRDSRESGPPLSDEVGGLGVPWWDWEGVHLRRWRGRQGCDRNNVRGDCNRSRCSWLGTTRVDWDSVCER